MLTYSTISEISSLKIFNSWRLKDILSWENYLYMYNIFLKSDGLFNFCQSCVKCIPKNLCMRMDDAPYGWCRDGKNNSAQIFMAQDLPLLSAPENLKKFRPKTREMRINFNYYYYFTLNFFLWTVISRIFGTLFADFKALGTTIL